MAFFSDLIRKIVGGPREYKLDTRTVFPDGAMSAFGVPVTAQESVTNQVLFQYGNFPNLVDASGVLGGSVINESQMAVISTGTGSTGEAVLESKRHSRYVAGLGTRAKFACFFTSGSDQSTQLIGLGDSHDGFFFGYSGSQFGICHMRDLTQSWYPQTTWNCDLVNGSNTEENPSGMNLDPTKGNVYMIKYQWLGYGCVSFSVEDDARGNFTPIHGIDYANKNNRPITQKSSLPFRVFTKNWGSEVAHSCSISSIGVSSEGLKAQNFYSRSKSIDLAGMTGSRPVMTLKSPHMFNGLQNHMTLRLELIAASNRTNNTSVNFVLVRDGVLNTSSFAYVDSANSPAQFDTLATSISGGVEVLSFDLASQDSKVVDVDKLDIQMWHNTQISVVMSASGLSNIAASITWAEEF